MKSRFGLFGIITALLVLFDQITKIWVVRNIDFRTEEVVVIDGFLSLVHAQNTGAAFGIMNDSPYRWWVFGVFTVIALGLLLQMLGQLSNEDRYQTVALGLITSGAIGNAIDRVHKQSVTDFVRVYTDHPELKPWLIEKFGTYEWPSWNVADACIVVGIALFAIHYLFLEKDEEEVEPEPPAEPLGDPALK